MNSAKHARKNLLSMSSHIKNCLPYTSNTVGIPRGFHPCDICLYLLLLFHLLIIVMIVIIVMVVFIVIIVIIVILIVILIKLILLNYNTLTPNNTSN